MINLILENKRLIKFIETNYKFLDENEKWILENSKPLTVFKWCCANIADYTFFRQFDF